jgi:hypothetical protein
VPGLHQDHDGPESPAHQKILRRTGTLRASKEIPKLQASVTAKATKMTGKDFPTATAGQFNLIASKTTKWTKNTPKAAFDSAKTSLAVRTGANFEAKDNVTLKVPKAARATPSPT